MRQSLITLGFFVGILSLPILVTVCGEGVAQAHRSHGTSDAPAAVVIGPVWVESTAK